MTMRIALVCPFDPRPRAPAPSGPRGGATEPGGAHNGGVERVYAELSDRLARRGHEVTLVASTSGPSATSSDGGITMVRRHRRMTLWRAPVGRLARHVPPCDVVQVAATYPFTTSSVLRRARRTRTASVLDFHFEPAPAGRLGRAAAAAYRRVGPRAYPLASAVAVRSAAYAARAPSLSRVPADRLHVVPNGIDPARFRPDGPRREGPYLLFVGRLVPYKGLDVLLAALEAARPGMPLVVAGDGPLAGYLRSLARRLHLEAQFLGHVPDDALSPLYRGARLTLLPSVNRQEAFGITLLESMACGTPVVASDLPGVADVARIGGRVSPPGDRAALARCITEALASDELPRGERLARRVHGAYSWDAVTDRFLEIYERLAEGTAPARPTPDREVMPLARLGGGPLL